MNKEPLASKIRPDDLEKFVGQEHLVSEGKPIRKAIEEKHLFSIIFWGPPGVGKTTLAKIYAQSLNADFIEKSAVSAGKNDIREIIKKAKDSDRPTVLFLDEIHRFNKAQQDFLLPQVESGILTLIGATTENPSFEVISPLLSRCKVFILNPLSESEMKQIINQALKEVESDSELKLESEAMDWLINMADGDARQAINMVEGSFSLYSKVNLETLKETLQSKHLRYDKKGEEHYNTISAYIKSMRAGDADAALYYLARMVEAGEDPLFIARRMVIFASEDVGLASSGALLLANEVFKSCQVIGYPECAINLAHGTAYLAQCKKDRRAYEALRAAQSDVKKYGNLEIPLKIRNAPTELMKNLDYGKGYKKYDKDSLLPKKIKGKKYLKERHSN